MGIVAPFLVLSAISGVLGLCRDVLIPFTMGLFMVLSMRVLHRSLLWWKRGAMQFYNGFANGLHVRASCRFVYELLATGHAFALRNAITSNPVLVVGPAWV